jgi:hypothetical protein
VTVTADIAPSAVVDVLAATLYKGYHDRNHKLWNIRLTKKYSNQRKPTSIKLFRDGLFYDFPIIIQSNKYLTVGTVSKIQ